MTVQRMRRAEKRIGLAFATGLVVAAAAVSASGADVAARKAAAWSVAQSQGWATRGEGFELMDISDGRVWMRQTLNRDAGISLGTDQVAGQPPYNVEGAGLAIGVWDQGLIRASHREVIGRVTISEAGYLDEHATSVAGTLAAAGSNAAARGMAPRLRLHSWEWNNDVAEMTARAMTVPNEHDKYPLSNNSYDFKTGWSLQSGTPYWYGMWGAREDSGFGFYGQPARDLDALAHGAPYFLQIKSCGNDRNDQAPAPGAFFYYWNGTTWIGKNYDPAADPYADGWDQGGYDTIPHEQNAKNILVVGAVHDAVSNGVRCLSNAAMTVFSGWGPTDDGRIKPDVVACGADITTMSSLGDTAYSTTFEGTSYAAPGVCGSAALLIELFTNRFPGAFMRASTLKALILHTADDLGRPGPDYMYGWGLMNTRAAADHILALRAHDSSSDMIEDALIAGQTQEYWYVWDRVNPVAATLCWTDPPGVANPNPYIPDDPTPRLVNDLDLRILAPDGGWEGMVCLRVDAKGNIAESPQAFSLIVSGLRRADAVSSAAADPSRLVVSWNAFSGAVYRVEHAASTASPQSWTPVSGVVTSPGDRVVFEVSPPADSGMLRFRWLPAP